jgi:hypothetical protein
LTDRSTETRVVQLASPLRDARVLRTLLLLDLESSALAAAVDVVAIELDPAPSRITQFSLLQRALPSPETLSTLTARLSALAGQARVGSPVLVDSHAPDACAMERYAPRDGAEGANGAKGANGAGANGATGANSAGAKGAKGATGANDAGAKGAKGATGANGAGAKGANSANGAGTNSANGAGAKGANSANSAGAKGATGANGAVLRRERRCVALQVTVASGRPVHIASSRRGIPYGAIVEAAGPWRTSGEWWTTSAAGGWNRDEWDVALKSGAVCRVYQDRTTHNWFFEGLYD